MTDRFINLHVHSMGSILDGFGTPEEIIHRAKKIGQEAVALTDHGSMAAVLRFYEAAKEEEVKPLIGIESYFAEDIERKEKDDKIYHLGLLARNNKGLEKLYALSDIGWNRGFYKKPRIDGAAIRSISAGRQDSDCIAISGCLDGYVSVPLAEELKDVAYQHAEYLKGLFEHFYIEIQPWNTPELNHKLLELADALHIPAVVTVDAHYCSSDEKAATEVSLIIQQSSMMKGSEKAYAQQHFVDSRKDKDVLSRINRLHPNRKIRFDKYDNYISSREEVERKMMGQGIDRKDIYYNTLEIAELCDASIAVSQNYFPEYLKSIDSDEYVRELAFGKLRDLGLDSDNVYVERLLEEIEIVTKLGFADYMLVIWDVVNYAHTHNIRTGPGRGSVGGSLLAYVLGITRIDPIKHNLLFFRFLNVDIDYKPHFEEIKIADSASTA